MFRPESRAAMEVGSAAEEVAVVPLTTSPSFGLTVSRSVNRIEFSDLDRSVSRCVGEIELGRTISLSTTVSD
jgi:hypothetical protein